MHRRRLWGVLAASALLLAGCVGATSRADYEAEIRSRGGGSSQDLVVGAVELVGRELGRPDYEVTSITANPASDVVTIVARGLGSPDDLDRFTVLEGRIEGVTPERVSVATDLDEETFPVSEIRFDLLDQMVDEAHGQFDSEGSYVATLTVSLAPTEAGTSTAPEIRLLLESDRSAATARFGADGRLRGFELR